LDSTSNDLLFFALLPSGSVALPVPDPDPAPPGDDNTPPASSLALTPLNRLLTSNLDPSVDGWSGRGVSDADADADAELVSPPPNSPLRPEEPSPSPSGSSRSPSKTIFSMSPLKSSKSSSLALSGFLSEGLLMDVDSMPDIMPRPPNPTPSRWDQISGSGTDMPAEIDPKLIPLAPVPAPSVKPAAESGLVFGAAVGEAAAAPNKLFTLIFFAPGGDIGWHLAELPAISNIRRSVSLWKLLVVAAYSFGFSTNAAKTASAPLDLFARSSSI
jgi:hypothetical protein